MSLTKDTIVDRSEALRVSDHYVLQIRMRDRILEDGNEISYTFRRTTYPPDHDVSTISDPVVLAQFNAVMTDKVKANYQTFLASQQPLTEESSE